MESQPRLGLSVELSPAILSWFGAHFLIPVIAALPAGAI